MKNEEYGKTRISILVLLDLSTAFDTVDHDILMKILETGVDLSELALDWFLIMFLVFGDFNSPRNLRVIFFSPIFFLLFNLYLRLPGQRSMKHNVSEHNYAVDTLTDFPVPRFPSTIKGLRKAAHVRNLDYLMCCSKEFHKSTLDKCSFPKKGK